MSKVFIRRFKRKYLLEFGKSQFTWKQVNPYFGSDEGFSSIPNAPGNYAIYTAKLDILNNKITDKKLIYIGTSSQLSNRLSNNHPILSGIRCLSDYYIFIKVKIVLDSWVRRDMEYRLIQRLKPRGNNVPKKARLTSNAVLRG